MTELELINKRLDNIENRLDFIESTLIDVSQSLYKIKPIVTDIDTYDERIRYFNETSQRLKK